MGKNQKNMEHLFSVTAKDFEMQVFRAGGKGGQKQNKTSSGVRIIHRDSGARGESRRERSQSQNKRLAFRHLVVTSIFQKWLRIKTAEACGHFDGIKDAIERSMAPKHLKVEGRADGQWGMI